MKAFLSIACLIQIAIGAALQNNEVSRSSVHALGIAIAALAVVFAVASWSQKEETLLALWIKRKQAAPKKEAD